VKRRPTRLEDADEQMRADFEAVKAIMVRVRDRDGRPPECLERGPLRVEAGADMTLFHYWGVAYGFTLRCGG